MFSNATSIIKRVTYLTFINNIVLIPHLMHELMNVFINSSTEHVT